MNEQNFEMIVYQPDESIRLEVRFQNETVWLTQNQLGILFGIDRSVISRHISSIYQCGELDETSTCAEYAQIQKEGAR